MLPVLLDIGFIKIYTLGAFLVLAFFWAAFLLWKNIKLTSYKEEKVFDGLFIAILGGLLFARIVYVALNFGDFGFSVLRFVLINGFPGLSLIGGIIGALLTFALYSRFNKMTFIHIIDYVVSPLLLALAIGKIGSFFAGSDVGTQTSFPLAIEYVGHEGPRHIVALYESLLFFIGFYFAHKLLYAVRREAVDQGATLYFFIMWLALTELALDILKQDHLYLANLSFNMLLSAAILVFMSVFLLTRYRKAVVSSIKKYGKKFTNKKTGRGTKKSTS